VCGVREFITAAKLSVVPFLMNGGCGFAHDFAQHSQKNNLQHTGFRDVTVESVGLKNAMSRSAQ
jgi:hypothetical protein